MRARHFALAAAVCASLLAQSSASSRDTSNRRRKEKKSSNSKWSWSHRSKSSSSASSDSLPPPEQRYRRIVAFGDSYSDSQSPVAVFSKWQDKDKAWPEHLRRYLEANHLDNYAISGAKSGRQSNLMGFTGGVFAQVDKFLEEQDDERLFTSYPKSTLVAWEVCGINDLLFSLKDESEAIYQNFKTTLKRMAKFKRRSKYTDLLIMPLTQGQHMPWHLKGPVCYRHCLCVIQESQPGGAHSFRAEEVGPIYSEVAKRMQDYLRSRCARFARKGLRIWMLDALELDEQMRRHFRNSHQALLGNQWRVWNGDYRREDFMWYDQIHWSDAANRFVARRMQELLAEPPLCL